MSEPSISFLEATERARHAMEHFTYVMGGPHLEEPTPIYDEVMAEFFESYPAKHQRKEPGFWRTIGIYLGLVQEP